MPAQSTDFTNDTTTADLASELASVADQLKASLAAPAPGYIGRTADGHDDLTQHLTTILQIPVAVKAVLGSISLPIAKLMKMKRGTIIPLDRRVGEPIELVVNGRTVAKGEIVVLEDGVPHLGICLTEVINRYAATGG